MHLLRFECDGSGGNWILVLQSSLGPQAISRTRKISGRIKSHLVLTLDSQSAGVLARVQYEEKIVMPPDVERGEAGGGTARPMSTSERVAGYREAFWGHIRNPPQDCLSRPLFFSLPFTAPVAPL